MKTGRSHVRPGEGRMYRVGVRFSPQLHKLALRTAKQEGISFGELVRRAVETRIGKGKQDAA